MPEDQQTQILPYLTTVEVKERYGFDPAPFVERDAAGGNFIRNKLTQDFTRLWLEADVKKHPSAKVR